MKWFKVTLVLGIALLISVAAFGGTTWNGAFNTNFSRYLNVYTCSGWRNYTIDSYTGIYKVNSVLGIDFEVGGAWKIQTKVDVQRSGSGHTTDAQAVLNAFEIGFNYHRGYAHQNDHGRGVCDFYLQNTWENLLWGLSCVDQSAANPILYFAWDTGDLNGYNVQGYTYNFTINFQLVNY